jgi:hypothetical protein
MANGRRFSISFVDAKESAGRMRQYSDPGPCKKSAPAEFARAENADWVNQMPSRKQWLPFFVLAALSPFVLRPVAGQCTGNFCVLNGVRIVDGTHFTTIQAACSDLPGGEVYIPQGVNIPTSPVACSSPTWIHGAGINQTIIRPSNVLTSTLFNTAGSGEGYKWSDMTIDMTNAPTVGVFSWTTMTRPILENVRVIYPNTTGTGTVILKSGAGEAHVRNLIVRGAGICVDIQGDSGQEDYWTDVVCEDPGSFGYRLKRTTATDVGGQYLEGFKITNPDNRTTAGGFLVTSSAVSNTAQPFYCSNCTADNMQGTHAAAFVNVNELFLCHDNWFANTAAAASNLSGLFLNGVTGVDICGGRIASNSRDLAFAGTDTTVHLISVRFAGTNTNLYAAGATLANLRITDPIYSASTPMSAADASAVANAVPSAVFSAGIRIGVSGSQSSPQTFSICNQDSAATAPCKFYRVNAAGQLEILNNLFSPISQVDDSSGGYYFPERTCPSVASGKDLLCADSATHSLLGAYNGLNLHHVPLVETGTCTMSASTSCTASIPAGFSSQSCFSTNGSGVAIASTCFLTGTTVTVNAASSNSNLWKFVVLGTPD